MKDYISLYCIFVQVVSNLRKSYKEGLIFDYEKRLEQLQALYRLLEENQDQLLNALHKDLGKVRIIYCIL